jgi:hypothetical protein
MYIIILIYNLCVYGCIYILNNLCVLVCNIYVYIYICVCFMYLYIYTVLCLDASISIYVYTYTYTYIIYIYTYLHIYNHTYIYICFPLYPTICVYIYMYIPLKGLIWWFNFFWLYIISSHCIHHKHPIPLWIGAAGMEEFHGTLKTTRGFHH